MKSSRLELLIDVALTAANGKTHDQAANFTEAELQVGLIRALKLAKNAIVLNRTKGKP